MGNIIANGYGQFWIWAWINQILPNGNVNSTFTLDTESLEWTYLGEWLLPFKGEAHYDSELDAWVGLCLYKEGAGHACCCDVPPAAGCQTMPAWKLGKDLLFDAGSSTHAGAKLVYMGDSRFCLVTCRKAKDYANNRSLRMLDMASFVITDQVQGRRTADCEASGLWIHVVPDAASMF